VVLVKTTDIILIGGVVIAAIFGKDLIGNLFGGAADAGGAPGASITAGTGGDAGASTYYWKPSQDYYPAEVYQTPLPVIPSELGVSSGIPTGSAITACPVLTSANRYPGDSNMICQCPKGNIQGGTAFNMNELMYGTDASDIAWRQAFCGL
jgi:hypothetical protein